MTIQDRLRNRRVGWVICEEAADTIDALVEALEWYAEQAAGCRKVTSEGETARNALDKDGGQRARAAIARVNGDAP